MHVAVSTACLWGSAMAETLLQIEGLSKRFGGIIASNDISLIIPPGELHAIIGPNGAGKTTLIAQLTGELKPTSGRVLFQGEDITDIAMPGRARMGLVRSF